MRIEALHRRGNHLSIDVECGDEEEAMKAFEKILALLETGLIDVEIGEAR